jgi:hypothetical protein
MDLSKQNRQLAVVERLGTFAWKWLGGRDSNPDNVVQRAVHAFAPAAY